MKKLLSALVAGLFAATTAVCAADLPATPPAAPAVATAPATAPAATHKAKKAKKSKKSSAAKAEKKANGCTLRGVASKPSLPSYEEVYGLRAGAIAVYPMYKGLAQLVGMDILGHAKTLDEQMEVLKENWDKYDFFFIHFKYTDSTGEDGNFEAKVKRTEEFDLVP